METPPDSPRPRCTQTTNAGTQCRSTIDVRVYDEYAACIAHDRKRLKEAARRRRNGGAATAKKLRIPDLPTTQEECESMLRWVLEKTLQRKIDAQVSRECREALQAQHKMIGERLKIEKRIRELMGKR